MQMYLALVDLQIDVLFFVGLAANNFVKGSAVLSGVVELVSGSSKLGRGEV
jgi:hypothetical protein